MKLSSIHEPIVEWPNKKPNPGYGLADLDRSHFKYYVGKIQSELNKPISIPANYISLYNNVDPSAKMGEANMQNYLNNYILKKFANANKFKITTVGTLSMPTDPKDYGFNVTEDLITYLAPGKNVQEIYNNTNKQLRLYYFGVIRNDPAKAQAEEEKQVLEDINLIFFTINEGRSVYSTKARAFYYNILLTKKFIELLLVNFCAANRTLDDAHKYNAIPKREWFQQLYKDLWEASKNNKPGPGGGRDGQIVTSVLRGLPQELFSILKKAYILIGREPQSERSMKFINYFNEIQELLGETQYNDEFREIIMTS